MSKKDTGPTIFDDDFEVTYEVDPIDIISLENEDNTVKPDLPSKDKITTKDKAPVKEKISSKTSKKNIRTKTQQNTEEFSPIKKVVKISKPKAYGNRHIYNTSFYIIRTASIILALSIVIFLVIDFLRGAAPYGDITTLLETQNKDLILYIAVAFIISLFYGLMLLFSFRRERVSKRGRKYKLDMGKGTFTYISLYVLSYLSFIFCAIIPDNLEFLGYTFPSGFVGALDVFGSMHNVLLGMCVAGVIACKARKHMN